DKLVGRKRDGLTHRRRRETFSKCRCGCFRSMFRSGFENGLAELIHPMIFGSPRSRISIVQFVLIEQFGQQGAGLIPSAAVGPGFGLNTITDGLSQERMRVLLADKIQQIPGAIREYYTMYFSCVLNRVEEVIKGITCAGLRECGEEAFGL